MKRTALPSLALATVLTVVAGCQTAPRFAWWKHDKAPEDTSAVARSATPVLPSAQTKPEAVAVAGLTPATPPSSSNLAAAGAPAGAPTGAMTSTTPSATTPLGAMGATAAPNVPIPVTSATLANAPTATYPTDNGLADKLVGTPSAPTNSPVPSATDVPAAGPYDPNGYKPTASPASSGSIANAQSEDRYGVGTMASTATMAAAPNNTPPLASDPADRYRYTPSPAATASMPTATALADPAAVAADRYANPTLPTMQRQPAMAASTAAAPPSAPAVRLASAPGQYRPGRTSSYTSAVATWPLEIASRPSPPSAASPAAPSATGAASQPWTPPIPTSTPPAGTRTY